MTVKELREKLNDLDYMDDCEIELYDGEKEFYILSVYDYSSMTQSPDGSVLSRSQGVKIELQEDY